MIDLYKPITTLESRPLGLGADQGDPPALTNPVMSHVRGPTDIPLLHQTVPQFFADTVSRFGGREAAVFCEHGLRLTYDGLSAKVDELAAALLTIGVGKGDRVGIWSPNRPEWLFTQLATARIGAVMVNFNPAYRLSELEFAINKVGCKVLITAASFKLSDYVGMLFELAPELNGCEPGSLRSERLPSLRAVVHTGDGQFAGMFGYREFLAIAGPAQQRRLDLVSAGSSPDDAINIQFTSGTTGLPKGATLTHFNIINNARFIAKAMMLSEQDRLCIPVPLYHCFGMVLGNLAAISTGSAMVFPGEGFDAGATLRAVSKERCTALHGVPTMFVAMLDDPGFASYDFSALRTGIMAGAPCPIEVMRKVIDRMNMGEVTIAYGMTETSPVSFQSSTADSVEKRVSTVGRVHPHVEVKIVDDCGETVPVNTVGELCTKGYSVMQGYWDEPKLTAKTVDAGGWMHTGDLAVLDEQGYCNVVGRVREMLIRGGENVYPREVEEFLFGHPEVQQVQVFGIPDKKYGEEVCAWIVLNEGAKCSEEEIRELCKGQIAHYKIPRYVRFVDELPMTVSGKPQKFKMREVMMKELGLDEQATA